MADKKKDKKTEKEPKKQRGKAGAAYVVLMTLVMLASVVLACTVFFRVENVEVEGIARYTYDQVYAAANVEAGSNLILTPAEQVEERIYAALSYVDTVEAKKRFPTTLRLEVVEAQPVAVVPGANLIMPNEEQLKEGMEPIVEPTGQWWIIDSKGKLLEQADEALAAEYIQVTGLMAMNPVQGLPMEVQSGDQGRLKGLLGLLQALESQEMIGQITAIDATLGTEIAMVYDGRVTVKMLNTTDFERKIRIFEDVSALLSPYDQGVLNLKSDTVFYSPNL